MLAEVNDKNILQIVINNHWTPYIFETWQKIKIGENQYENHTTVEALVQYQSKNAEGYQATLKIQNITQSAKDSFAELMNELLPVNNHFVLRINKQGMVEHLLNHERIIQTWINLKKELQIQYRDQKEVLEYLEAYEQELSNPVSLIQAMKYKGITGGLFPGIYNHSLTIPGVFQDKNYFKYFHVCDLPLQYAYTYLAVNNNVSNESKIHQPKRRYLYLNEEQQEAENAASLINILGKGKIIEDSFDRKAFTRIIKDILGVSLYNPVIDLTANEAYNVQKQTGLIENATQELTVEVTGVYYNSIKSSLTRGTTKNN